MRLKLFIFLLLFVQIKSFELSAQCNNSVVPPTTINNIYITHNYSGSVTFYTTAFISNCATGNVTTPPNSVWLGRNGSFSYTLNFNTNVNNLVIAITATGNSVNENFVFTTNRGNPNITSSINCLTMIVGNEIISGSQTNPGASGSSGGGGGGIFTISNNIPFNTLTITGNGGQNGSLLALCSSSIILVNKSSFFSQTIYRCPNSPFAIGNKSHTVPGRYIDTLVNYLNADSIVTTTLIHHPSYQQTISSTICEGDTFKMGSKKYTESGVYVNNYVSRLGCDSIVTLNLNVNVKTEKNIEFTICDGDTLLLNNKVYSKEGLFQDTLVNFRACDSLLNITINQIEKSYYTYNYFICPEDTIIHNNQIFNEIGETIEILKSYRNCDSIVSIKVQLLPKLNECKDATFFIPTAFSPNNDGHNDVFKIEGEHIKEIEMMIFNRWGEILFQKTDQSAQWDGYYQQDICQDGLYFYQVKLKAKNLKIYYKNGTIHLIK
jgi:gliding motility-associated-like protein